VAISSDNTVVLARTESHLLCVLDAIDGSLLSATQIAVPDSNGHGRISDVKMSLIKSSTEVYFIDQLKDSSGPWAGNGLYRIDPSATIAKWSLISTNQTDMDVALGLFFDTA